MNQSQQVLRAFLAEKMEEQGVTADLILLNRLTEHVVLREGRSDIKEEDRAIDITKGTDNKYAATRISAFNLLELSFTDVFGMVLSGGEIALLGPISSLAYAFAICGVINEFIQKTKAPLNETDAKILLALYRLKKKRFTPEELQAAYLEEFKEALADDQLQRSLASFKQKYIVRYRGENIYQLRELVTYDRP